MPPGIVVGLTAEARLARDLGCPVLAGGGMEAGAAVAAERLAEAGAGGLVSFGLAGGLAPDLAPGAVLVPRAVLAGAERFMADSALAAWLGGFTAEAILAGTAVVPDRRAKQALHAASGAAAVDLESGAVARVAARRGLPFAVLRAVCDPAGRDLPPAALAALDARGAVAFGRVLRAVLADPRQIPALLHLAGDAAAARRALLVRVRQAGAWGLTRASRPGSCAP